MTVRQRQDRRALHASRDLEGLAARLAAAKDHVTDELMRADGAVAAQTFSDGSRSTDATTKVEAVVLLRADLFARLLSMDADMDGIVERIRRLYRTCIAVTGMRLPGPEAKRCEADPTMAGYLVSLVDGGWFDPTCDAPSRSATGGQCDRCRKRLERWRDRTGRNPLPDERIVEHESTVVVGELGAMHARPTT